MVLAAAAVRSALAAELGLAPEIVPVTTPVECRDLGREFVKAILTHRVLPLVAPAGDALGLAPEVVEDLDRAHRDLTMAAMTTVATTAQVSSALRGAGVPHLLLKGVSLAVQTTGDPLARGAGDVDILMATGRVKGAVGALESAGLRADRVSVPAPGSSTFSATVRSQKALTLWGPNLEVDLHWRLDHVRSCLTWRFEELLEAAEPLTIAGIHVQTLSRPYATIYNASHAGSDGWSHLRAFVDQARLQHGQDLAALRTEASRVGAGRRWDLAQAMLATLLDQPPPPLPRPLSATAEALWRWLLAGEGPRNRRNARASARGLSASLLTLDSPRAGLQRAEAVVWPVGAMADRALGNTGDRHPWLYPLATPYFLPKRLVERWRAGAE
jgi:hypothetical protein